MERKLGANMSFTKVGDDKPLLLSNQCCVCKKAAVQEIDGKLYCSQHLPEKNDDIIKEDASTNE